MYFLSLMQGNMHSLSHSVTSNSFVTPWTAACQAPLSMGFYRQEYWCGVSFPSSGDRLEPGIEPGSHALQEDSLLSESPGFETLSWGKRRALIQNGLVWISRMPFPSWTSVRSSLKWRECYSLLSIRINISRVQMIYEKCFSEVFVLKECTLGKAKHIIQSKYYVRRGGLATGILPVFLFHCTKYRHGARWSLRGL